MRRRHPRLLVVVIVVTAAKLRPPFGDVRVEFALVHFQPKHVGRLLKRAFEENRAEDASESKSGSPLEYRVVKTHRGASWISSK